MSNSEKQAFRVEWARKTYKHLQESNFLAALRGGFGGADPMELSPGRFWAFSARPYGTVPEGTGSSKGSGD
eukprot:13461323-Alexandrium_andersonii.AAC.1